MNTITAKILCLSFSILLMGSDSSSSTDTSPTKITSSKAVGDEMDTMQECKYRLDQTAKKYNVSYTVDKDEKEKFIGYIVKDGTQTDLLAMCKKDGDYYSAMFQIPDEK